MNEWLKIILDATKKKSELSGSSVIASLGRLLNHLHRDRLHPAIVVVQGVSKWSQNLLVRGKFQCEVVGRPKNGLD